MYLKRKFREGQSFDTWVLKSFLNTGGNGEVWVAEDDKKQAVAIKILRKIGKNAKVGKTNQKISKKFIIILQIKK